MKITSSPYDSTRPGYFDLPVASNINIRNLIVRSDSYKFGHKPQYPKGTEMIFAYGEFRIDNVDIVPFGFQYHINELFSQRVTYEDLRQARAFSMAHFGRDLCTVDDWVYIIEHYEGRIPLTIYGVREGEVMPSHNVMFVIFNRDKRLFWLTNFFETPMSWVWYTSTIATNSFHSKTDIRRGLQATGCDPALADYMLHDFGYRGVTCFEQAQLGGLSHLTSFRGTDTTAGILAGIKHYDSGMIGHSINASEHSTITSWGLDDEVKACENMLDIYPDQMFACVGDSRNIYDNVSKIWGGALKDRVMRRNNKVVIRPDSGDPVDVNRKLLKIAWDCFGGNVNEAGFRVLDQHVGFIQGDGIDRRVMNNIIDMEIDTGYAVSNIGFGSGGGLLQKFNRDTYKFAIKCSAAVINGSMRLVYKDPVDDPGKKSKTGFVCLSRDAEGDFKTVSHFDPMSIIAAKDSAFVPYLDDGEIVRHDGFANIVGRIDAAQNKIIL